MLTDLALGTLLICLTVLIHTVGLISVGFSDVHPALSWRLFAALESIDGLILIGWSIAYLVAASNRHGPFRLGEHF